MAGRPLRPATDRRLGEPLPHQLANPTWAHPSARGLTIPRFHPKISCGISPAFAGLFPTKGQIPMYYAPVRRSSARIATPVTARLACVKHAASVQSEPGSNSSVQWFELKRDPKLQTCPVLPGRLDAWLLAVAPIWTPDASPHTNYLLLFKERPGNKSARESRLLCPASGAPNNT